jgi:diadenylate cyclase
VALLEAIGDYFEDFGSKLRFLFGNLNLPWDIIDVLVVTFILYEFILLVRDTRASQLAKGIILLLLAYVIALIANLRTLAFTLSGIMSFGIVVLAVIFQPELRRAIDGLGGVNSAFARVLRPQKMGDALRSEWEKTLVLICDAAERLAEERTGALFVIEKHTNLIEIIRTGTLLQSAVNVEILGTIFYEGTPLHDGAIVIRDAKIEAAGCFLPLSNNLEISKDMGTRHRSALGMSENSDAIVVVVSEETGIISLAKKGVLIRRLNRQNLLNLLICEIVPPITQTKKGAKKLKGKLNEQKK